MSTRRPPQNIEAERSTIGAMLLNPDAVPTVIEALGPRLPEDLFYHPPHQHIYDAMLQIFTQNKPIDAITLLHQLKGNNKLDAAGGAAYIAELTRAVPTSANVEYYARIVLDTATLRSIITTGTRIISQAYAADQPADELLNQAEAEFFAIADQGAQADGLIPITQGINAAVAHIEHIAAANGLHGMPTGVAPLDNVLHGIQDQELIILAARPSVGKTSLSLAIAGHIAIRLKLPVYYFSLEMSKGALIERMLIAEGGVDGDRLKRGFLARHEIPKVHQAAQKLTDAPLYIDDTPGITPMQLRAKARRLATRIGMPSLIIIDYLQIMGKDGKKSERRDLDLAEISAALLQIRKELRCPIIALCQLSREAEKGENAHPRLAHLRESGAIEQDADVVIMLSKLPSKDETPHHAQRVRIAIEKNRNGATGVTTALFQKNTGQWHAETPGEHPENQSHQYQAPQHAHAQATLPYKDDNDEYPEDDFAF